VGGAVLTPERWARVKEVFGEAFELAVAARPAFLDSACEGDAELRADVERLLEESESDSLHSPASGILKLASELRPGDAVAHYRIESRLGEGGMGVVYKAADSRLGRSVALKVVKAEFGSRSQREARAVAALNHPNICTIHDVGPNYLVMELIEGPTLAERIATGAIPLQEARDIARQIAEALEAAHEKGIVHRDLKPANIKVTTEGKVKVLDFGLAQIAVPAAGNPVDSPTMTATQPGMILGTAAYMSPEQASGKPVDKRADIWAFGVVLWEMVTGRRLFEGETVTQTLAEVLRGPIDLERTPGAVRNLLGRCLDRDVRRRLRDIGEARIALDEREAPPSERAPVLRQWLAWSVAAVAVAGLASISFLYFREKPLAVLAPLRFQIPMPDHLGPVFSLSPNGRQLAFQAGGQGLGIYSLESGTTRYLGVGGYSPCWSPDGRFIAYRSDGRKLMRIEATGGSPSVLAESPPGRITSGCAWNQDDVILIVSGGGIFKVPASGGVPVAVTAPDRARPGGHQIGPSFLQDGRHFFYASHSIDERNNAIYLGSVDATPEQQSSKPLLESHWQAVYAASADPDAGYLLFMREDALMAQPFDNRHLELSGPPVTIAGQVSHAANGAAGWGAFSVSANGVLSFQASRFVGPSAHLVWPGRRSPRYGWGTGRLQRACALA
jgi:predicted Ser/Thr protein kinase